MVFASSASRRPAESAGETRVVAVIGAAASDHPELRAAVEGDDSYVVAWAPTVAALTILVARRRPQVVLVVLSGPRRGLSVDWPAGVSPALIRPAAAVAVLPAGASESDIERLHDVADMLMPPFDAIEVRGRIRRLLDRERARTAAETRTRVVETLGLETLLGDAPAFATVKARLPVIARADTTVLISGETGTGKEMVARAVHYLSPRAHGPFIPVDCGAIPVDLFENELFGHRRGAFTDARSAEAGLIAEAEGGTLFLDEVDAIPLRAQTKLLRFLQSQTYRALGGATLQQADVRVVAATNADLESNIDTGAFRKDLYYRLNIIPLSLPALHERPGDVPVLCHHFLDKWAAADGRERWRFSPEALQALAAYAWPGNVRELENLVHQIVATLPPGTIEREHLPAKMTRVRVSGPVRSFREAKAHAIASFERDYASRLLAAWNGNVTRAAQAAGQDRRVFGRLVKKHHIKDAAPDPFDGGRE